MDIVIFDNETTGLLKSELSDIKEQPYITEFCAVKIDHEFNFISEIETLVKPGMPIPDFLEEKIGITNKMVENAPEFIEVYDHIADFFLGCSIGVAHNAPFDFGVLKFELIRHDLQYKFPWPKNHLCTIEKSYHINNRRLNLNALHELATGEPITGWHRAKTDVYGLIRCLKWLVEEGHVDLNNYM